MPVTDVGTLGALVARERHALLTRWREQVKLLPSARGLDNPTLNDHVPDLIDELAVALQLRSDETIPEAHSEASPPAHGIQRLGDGFDIEEVVAEYNILRGCIHDLAESNGMVLRGASFHILNRVFDGAIGSAVQAYAAQRAREVQQRRDEYLAFVAHDLRTPLNAISVATRVLEMRLPEGAGPESRQMLKILRRSAVQLDGMVGKVLEENTNLTAEPGVHIERRTLDLWPFVETLVHDLGLVAGTAGTRLVNRVPDELFVYADAGLLRRIFQNLVANAVRYTPNGEVIIGARSLDPEGTVEVSVSDNGAGIPPSRIDKVFDKLETDPEMEGTSGFGLGLAIVKAFVEAHDGHVTAESTEGAGSTFRFTLPARTEKVDGRAKHNPANGGDLSSIPLPVTSLPHGTT